MKTSSKIRKLAFLLVVVLLASVMTTAFAQLNVSKPQDFNQKIQVFNISNGSKTTELKLAYRVTVAYTLNEKKDQKVTKVGETKVDAKYYTYYTAVKNETINDTKGPIGVSTSHTTNAKSILTKNDITEKINGKANIITGQKVKIEAFAVPYKFYSIAGRNSMGQYIYDNVKPTTATYPAATYNHKRKQQ